MDLEKKGREKRVKVSANAYTFLECVREASERARYAVRCEGERKGRMRRGIERERENGHRRSAHLNTRE